MEPRIQYAKSYDGVSIAFWTLGNGTPLLYIPSPPLNHLQMEWQIPELRGYYERLARGRMLVRYDHRGCGLSQRDVSDYSVDSLVADTHAVAERLGVTSFDLLGSVHSGPVAIAYAARHRERVRHLVLWCTYARGSDYSRPPRSAAIYELLDKDWELYAETTARYLMGYPAIESSGPVAAMIRESSSPEVQRAFAEGVFHIDVEALLGEVKAPTLILHRRQARYPVALARHLASEIAGARLVLLEGASSTMALEDSEAVAQAIDEFLGQGEEATEEQKGLPEGTAIILFVDIAGSTALTEQLGDAAFRTRARELDTSLRTITREAGGTPVEGKVLGDGVMAVFTSARQAIECAIRCNAAAEGTGLQLHLGIHAGDVIREGNNIYGGAVNVAARVASASAPGEILVSDIVRGLARTSADVVFEDRGEHTLRGIAHSQRLFAVRPRE